MYSIIVRNALDEEVTIIPEHFASCQEAYDYIKENLGDFNSDDVVVIMGWNNGPEIIERYVITYEITAKPMAGIVKND